MAGRESEHIRTTSPGPGAYNGRAGESIDPSWAMGRRYISSQVQPTHGPSSAAVTQDPPTKDNSRTIPAEPGGKRAQNPGVKTNDKVARRPYYRMGERTIA